MTQQLETPMGMTEAKAKELVALAMNDSTGRESLECGCWTKVVSGVKIENKCAAHSQEYVAQKKPAKKKFELTMEHKWGIITVFWVLMAILWAITGIVKTANASQEQWYKGDGWESRYGDNKTCWDYGTFKECDRGW